MTTLRRAGRPAPHECDVRCDFDRCASSRFLHSAQLEKKNQFPQQTYSSPPIPDIPFPRHDEPPTGSATIFKIDKLPNRRYQLTLSDGAIWREIEGSSFRRYKVGAEVTIKRGAFGSHTLLTPGVRAKVTPVDP